MAANYLPYEPDQMLLLPESLQEWLPEGHLAHFISDAVFAKTGLTPSSQRVPGWSNASAMRTSNAGAATTMTRSRAARTASPRAGSRKRGLKALLTPADA